MATGKRASSKTRDQLVQAVHWRGRRMSSLQVFYSQAAAERLGMNLNDMMCLGILAGAGPITAGQLAILLGLTSGAVTGLVDRLERQGLVERKRDTGDRRRVLIELSSDPPFDASVPFQPMLARLSALYDDYSNEDLETLSTLFDRINQIMQEETAALRAQRSTETAPDAEPTADSEQD